MENEDQKSKLTFLDRYLDIPEPKVTYLTKITWIDRIIAKLFLPFFPEWVTPNQITQFRLLTIPFIIYFFIADHYLIGTIIFLFSALSDALDGALARTKHKITTWGTLYDPIADKFLIGLTALVIVSKYISVSLALTMCFLEICLIASAYLRYKGRVVPAKTMGKTKMVLQCFGIIFLLFYILYGVSWLFITASALLYLSIVFALLSLFVFRSI